MAKPSRYTKQAKQLAAVRFGPEQSALRALAGQAASTFQTTASTEKGAAAALQHSARSQIAPVAHLYDAAAQKAGIPSLAQGRIDAGGPLFQASAAQEQSGFQSRIAADKAGAVSNLRQTGVQAQQGYNSALRQALGVLNANLDKVNTRSQELAGEKGNFTAATVGDLLDKAGKEKFTAQQNEANRQVTLHGQEVTAQGQKRSARQSDMNSKRSARQSDMNSQRSAGIDPSSGKAIPGGKAAKGKGAKRAAGEKTAHKKVLTDFNNAVTVTKSLKQSGVPLNDVMTVLTGNKSDKNPYGGFDPVIATAARDYLKAGRIGPYNQRQLKEKGLIAVPRRYKGSPSAGSKALQKNPITPFKSPF